MIFVLRKHFQELLFFLKIKTSIVFHQQNILYAELSPFLGNPGVDTRFLDDSFVDM